ACFRTPLHWISLTNAEFSARLHILARGGNSGRTAAAPSRDSVLVAHNRGLSRAGKSGGPAPPRKIGMINFREIFRKTLTNGEIEPMNRGSTHRGSSRAALVPTRSRSVRYPSPGVIGTELGRRSVHATVSEVVVSGAAGPDARHYAGWAAQFSRH